jgi:hypothetical protein
MHLIYSLTFLDNASHFSCMMGEAWALIGKSSCNPSGRDSLEFDNHVFSYYPSMGSAQVSMEPPAKDDFLLTEGVKDLTLFSFLAPVKSHLEDP